MKAEQVIIPSKVRKEMLKKVHAGSHQGIASAKRRDREVLY